MRSAITYVGLTSAALFSLLPMCACQQQPEYGYARPQQNVGGENVYQEQQPPQQQQQPPPQEQVQTPAPQSQVLSVNDRFEQPLPDHCQYTSTVRGTVRQVSAGGSMQNMQGMLLYEPNLVVNAEVNCPNVQSEHISSHTLNREQLTKKELEAAIAERASVVTVSHNRVCTIEPKYVLAPNGLLRAEGAREMCAVSTPAPSSNENEQPQWDQHEYDQNGLSPDINQTH